MPEAILLQDVDELGERGTVIDVSKGYLRNYLIPRKLAQPATRGAIEAVRRRQEAAERAQRNAVERAEENVKLLNRTVLTIPQRAGAYTRPKRERRLDSQRRGQRPRSHRSPPQPAGRAVGAGRDPALRPRALCAGDRRGPEARGLLPRAPRRDLQRHARPVQRER